MALSYILNYSFVKLVACMSYGSAGYHAAQGYDGHVRSSSAYIRYHAACGSVHRKSRAYGCGHRFFKDIYFAGAHLSHYFFYGSLLYFRNACRDSHRHAVISHLLLLHGSFYKSLEHIRRLIEVGDDSVLKRPHYRDVSRRLAQHGLGVRSHCKDLGRI